MSGPTRAATLAVIVVAATAQPRHAEPSQQRGADSTQRIAIRHDDQRFVTTLAIRGDEQAAANR